MTTQLQLDYSNVESDGETLPDSWDLLPLGRVAEINPRRPSAMGRSDTQLTSFVPMAAVDEQYGIIASADTKPFREVKKGYTYFAEGDVLFAKITPCMQNGKHAVARGLIDGIGFGTTEFHVIRPSEKLLAEWVHSYIRQPKVLRDATAHFTGAVGQQRVPKDYLSNLPIPLPPLAEQKRIAGILKEQLAAVERARAAAESQLAAAKALPAAYLREVFEGPASANWQRRHVGDFAKVQSGYAFKSDWFVDDGIRLLRNANIFQNRIEWEDVAYLPESQRANFSAYELAVGDIVLALDRPIVSNGLKVARLTKQDVPALLLQRVGRFQLRGERIDSDYLLSFLNSPSFVARITGHDQSLGVPHISPKQVESVELPAPDMDLQQELAAKIKKILTCSESIVNSLRQQLDEIENMSSALLREAFQGKL